jgi:hypothetical protein
MYRMIGVPLEGPVPGCPYCLPAVDGSPGFRCPLCSIPDWRDRLKDQGLWQDTYEPPQPEGMARIRAAAPNATIRLSSSW